MKIAICDDEKAHLDLLDEAIQGSCWFAKDTIEIERFNCGEDLVNAFKNKKIYDYLYLDIKMSGMDGLATYEKLRPYHPPTTIFLSSFANYLPDVYLQTRNFLLLKPYIQSEFDKTMKACLQNEVKTPSYKYLQNGRLVEIPLSTIRYFKIGNHSLSVLTNEVISLPRIKLDDIERELCPFGFFRCYRSFLLNLKYAVDRYDDSIILSGVNTGEFSIKISKNRAHKFDYAFFDYKKER